MNRFFERIVNVFRRPTATSTSIFSHLPTISVPSVTPQTAGMNSAVFACGRVISETLAMLEWETLERVREGKDPRPDHPVSYLLSVRPNPDVPAMVFREGIVWDMVFFGNAYAEIQWNNAGVPVALWQIPAQDVWVDRDTAGNLIYRVSVNSTGEPRILAAADVCHWRNVSTDGLMGISTIGQAANAIRLGMQLEGFASLYFQNAPGLSGWIEYPGMLPSKTRADEIIRSFHRAYSGRGKFGGTALLESGMTYKQFQLPFKDAQFLDSRIWQAEELCRWFRVPPRKIGIQQEGNAATTEADEIAFMNETLLPMSVRLQQEVDYKLFGGENRSSKFFTKHNLLGIVRGDLQSRPNAYSIGVRYGWWSINDIRRFEDQNDVPEGDVRTVQLNTVPLSTFEEYADLKLDQAAADVDLTEAKTQATLAGPAPRDMNDVQGGQRDPQGKLPDGSQAETPPDDQEKQSTQTVNFRERELAPLAPGTTPNRLLERRRNGTTNSRTIRRPL